MRLLSAALLSVIFFGGCEDPAKRVKSDPNATQPSQQYEQGHIDTH